MHATWRVVLTRTPVDNAPLAAALAGLPVDVVTYPCVAIAPLIPAAEVLKQLLNGHFDAVVFASRHAVTSLLSGRALPPPKRVVAIGASTKAAVVEAGWPSPMTPTNPNASGFAAEVESLLGDAVRILNVRGEQTTGLIAAAVRPPARSLSEVVVYRNEDPVTRALPASPARTLAVFASPSAVAHFAAHNPATVVDVAVAIGDTTAHATEDHGWPTVVSEAPSPEALVAAVARVVAGA